jgi:signal peptidase I
VSAGEAMAPTIQVGDHFGYAGFGIERIERFDIVTYSRKSDPRRGIDETMIFVSRVIGMPGETVELKNGKVFINGAELDESGFEKIGDNDTRKAVVVPEQAYFLLGDNRPNSEDSRYIGPIERKNIGGLVSNIIRKVDYDNGRRW